MYTSLSLEFDKTVGLSLETFVSHPDNATISVKFFFYLK